MTYRLTTSSALSLILVTAACAGGGNPGAPSDDDPAITALAPSGNEEAETLELARPDDSSHPVSIRGHVASVVEGQEGQEGIVDVNVCVVEPVFGCTTTNELGNFELSYMPEDRPVELVFFRDDYLPAKQQASTAAGVSVLMVPFSSVTGEMDAGLTERGALVIEMLPFSYEPNPEIAPVELKLEGGSIHYLDTDGMPDSSLTAISPHGIALALGVEPGLRRLEATKLGNDACVFFDGGHYTASREVVVTERSTTTLTLLCGAM